MNTHVIVLVVGRQTQHRAATVAALKERGYEVLEADTADEAVRIITVTANLRLVVCDLELDGHHGAKYVHQHAGEALTTRGGVILITATELPRTLPRKIGLDYCRDAELPIFSGQQEELVSRVLTHIAAHLAQMAG